MLALFTAASSEAAAPPDPTYFTMDSALYRLCVWTAEEWEALPAEDRPAMAEYIPGLGWVGGELAGPLDI